MALSSGDCMGYALYCYRATASVVLLVRLWSLVDIPVCDISPVGKPDSLSDSWDPAGGGFIGIYRIPAQKGSDPDSILGLGAAACGIIGCGTAACGEYVAACSGSCHPPNGDYCDARWQYFTGITKGSVA